MRPLSDDIIVHVCDITETCPLCDDVIVPLLDVIPSLLFDDITVLSV